MLMSMLMNLPMRSRITTSESIVYLKIVYILIRIVLKHSEPHIYRIQKIYIENQIAGVKSALPYLSNSDGSRGLC
jgi:hypothetical protein